MKYLSVLLLLVGAIGTTGCASTWTEARVGVDATVDPVNGVSVPLDRFVRQVAEEFDRQGGPKLYYITRYGQPKLVLKNSVIRAPADQGHVRFYLVANCNPERAEVLVNGAHYRTVHAGNWTLPLPNQRTNFYRNYRIEVDAEDGRSWYQQFSVLSSGPWMPIRRR